MKLPFAIFTACVTTVLAFAIVFCLATLLFDQFTPVHRDSTDESILGPVAAKQTDDTTDRDVLPEQPVSRSSIAQLQRPVFKVQDNSPVTTESRDRAVPEFRPATWSNDANPPVQVPERILEEEPGFTSSAGEAEFELVHRETESDEPPSLPLTATTPDQPIRPIIVKSQQPQQLWEEPATSTQGLTAPGNDALTLDTEIKYANQPPNNAEMNDGQWLRSLLNQSQDVRAEINSNLDSLLQREDDLATNPVNSPVDTPRTEDLNPLQVGPLEAQATQRPIRAPDSQTEIAENATRSESSDRTSESTEQVAPDVIA
ncbi:MAG: hypothetical protein ACR2NP_12860, partial [Pirellulaceae bacterium]